MGRCRWEEIDWSRIVKPLFFLAKPFQTVDRKKALVKAALTRHQILPATQTD